MSFDQGFVDFSSISSVAFLLIVNLNLSCSLLLGNEGDWGQGSSLTFIILISLILCEKFAVTLLVAKYLLPYQVMPSRTSSYSGYL